MPEPYGRINDLSRDDGGQRIGSASADIQDAAKISISRLSFDYAASRALHDVSMVVYERRITALIGHSGSGKSTLLRTINRLNETMRGTAMQGEILLDGENVRHIDAAKLRKRVGMVFQTPNPFPMSIFKNVAYGLRVHGHWGRAALAEGVEKSLRRAALWDEVKDRLRQSAHSLSGGQQQRLCIARALAIHPEVLLLDEPCSALDPVAAGKIEELLVALKESCTLLLVTHNIHQAKRIADYTATLSGGRLIGFDTTAAALNDALPLRW